MHGSLSENYTLIQLTRQQKAKNTSHRLLHTSTGKLHRPILMHWTTGKIYRPIPNTCTRMVQGHRGHAGSMWTKIPPYLLYTGAMGKYTALSLMLGGASGSQGPAPLTLKKYPGGIIIY
jgi:hypothetical protein